MSSRDPKPICERIGRRINEERKAKRLSLDALAERTELSKTYLWELEKGRCEPGAGTIVRLCRALGISADSLLGTHDE
jgi:transcriptional regulator with XRE-family HTH domain